jgi:hypothetical protein
VAIGTLFVEHGLSNFFLAATRPEARGRGWYRAMSRRRMADAGGLPLGAVFSDMSRPVAESRLGFLPITRFTLWRFARP